MMQTFAVDAAATIAGLDGRPPAAGQVVLTIWTDRVGGQQVTRIFDTQDRPVPPEITTDDRGRFPFRADVAAGYVWARHGDPAAPDAVWLLSSVESVQTAATAGAGYPSLSTQVENAVSAGQDATAQATAAITRAAQATDLAGDAVSIAAEARDAAGAGTWSMSTPGRLFPRVQTYEAWPHTAITPRGTWLIAHAARTAHTAPANGQVAIRRSTDRGRTWTTNLLTPGAGIGWTPEAIGPRRRGGVHMIVSQISNNIHDSVDSLRIYGTNVADGNSWTFIVSIPTNGKIATVGNLIMTRSGRLIAPYHGDAWGMVISDDDGDTWRIVDRSNGGPWMMEGRLVETLDGRLVGIGRHNELGLTLFVSENDGDTWTRGRPTGLGSLTEAFDLAGDRLTLVTIDRATRQMDLREASLTVLVDDPTAWSAPTRLAQLLSGGTGFDCGYPDLARSADGSLVLSFYSGYRTTSVYAAVLSRSAAQVNAASGRSIRPLLAFPNAIDRTSTATTGIGTLIYAFQADLFAELGQQSQVWIKITARVRHSVAGGRVTINVLAQGSSTIIATTEVTCPVANAEYFAAADWVRIPDNYTDDSVDGLRSSQISVRALSNTAGTVTVMQPTTVTIGGSS